jgi:hypothetical protein
VKSIRTALLTVLLVSAAPLTGAASEAAPDSVASPEPPVGHELWLRGPFGRLPGGSVEQPAAAQPGMIALDTFSRDAPLSLDGGSRSIAYDTLTVRALEVAQPDAPAEILSTGEFVFTGPSTTGTALLVAELIDAKQQRSEHAWLLEVPDRDAPADGLLDIPAPDTLVEAGTQAVAGSPGHGCYIDLCVEIGSIAPLDMLPELHVPPGEPLSARLSDGSAIIAWEGSLEPLSDTPGAPISSEGAISDEVEASIGLVGLEAPDAGAWLLTLKVYFDRERGWMTTSYRLAVE